MPSSLVCMARAGRGAVERLRRPWRAGLLKLLIIGRLSRLSRSCHCSLDEKGGALSKGRAGMRRECGCVEAVSDGGNDRFDLDRGPHRRSGDSDG